MAALRNIISLFVIFMLIVSVPAAAATDSTGTQDQGTTGADTTDQSSQSQNSESQTLIEIAKLMNSIDSANKTLQDLKELLKELNLFKNYSQTIIKLAEEVKRAKEELTEGDVNRANETITGVWMGIAGIANDTGVYLRKNLYIPLEPRVNACKNNQSIQTEFRSVDRELKDIKTIFDSLKNGKPLNYRQIREAVSMLKAVKDHLDKIRKDIEECFGIVPAKKALLAIKRYQKFLGVDNATIKELDETITKAETELKDGNFSAAMATIKPVKEQILSIIGRKYDELKKELEFLKNASSYCSENRTLKNRLKNVNWELSNINKTLSLKNADSVLASLKRIQNNLEHLKKDIAKCLIVQASEKMVMVNATYKELPQEYRDVIVSPLNAKLTKAKNAFKSGDYDDAINLSIGVERDSDFQAIKKRVLERMEEKLNVKNVTITEQKLSGLEQEYRRIQLRLQDAKKKKPSISIIGADDNLLKAEEDLKKANITFKVIRAYLEAKNAKNPKELIAAVREFNSALSKSSSQVEDVLKNATVLDGTQIEMVLSDANESIDAAESRYTWNKVLLAVILLLLLAGLGFGGYMVYTRYQEKKRVDEAEAAIETMKEILQELSARMRQLGLATDNGVMRILDEMSNLIAKAQEAFERGDYTTPIRLKDKFIAKYDVLKTRIEPYEKTLRVDLSKHVAAKSYIGRRQNNEDAYTAEKIGGNILLAVADGMGGHLAGEVASRKAIEILRETLERNKFGDPEEIFREAIKRANRVIYQMGHDPAHPERYNMGTTLTAAIIRGDTATVANVGDSRTYLIRPDGTIKRLTKDHSLVQELIDRGEITEEEARRHPQKNVITKALGIAEDIHIDKEDIKKVTLRKGDHLLLCSDGLTDSLTDEEIARTVVSSPSLEDAVRILVDKAYGYGSDDNITVVLYRH